MNRIRNILPGLIILFLFGCMHKDLPIQTTEPSPQTFEQGVLLGTFSSVEEAEETGELYGISLYSYENGMAIFHTDKNLDDLIEKGKQNQWEILHKNYIYEGME